MDFSKIVHEVPQLRTARLINGKWVVLDSIAHSIVQEVKYRHYERMCRILNKDKK
jgi:hypothetical protein